jgi:putative transcriptional regulator
MIRANLDELRIKRARETGQRKITLRDVEAATGISAATLQRLGAGKTGAIQFTTLETLCTFFNCTVGDLLEVVPAAEVSP